MYSYDFNSTSQIELSLKSIENRKYTIASNVYKCYSRTGYTKRQDDSFHKYNPGYIKIKFANNAIYISITTASQL